MKKYLGILLAVVITAAVAIGSTVAYFSNEDKVTNVFTLGNVNIEIEEVFEQDSLIIPGRENMVQKEVTIKNTGNMEAWTWFTVTMPAAYETYVTFQGNQEPFVYLGYPGATWDIWADQFGGTPDWHHWTADEGDVRSDGVVMAENFVGDDGVEYIRYTSLYLNKLDAGATTSMGLKGVYLTSLVTTKENADGEIEYYITDNDEDVKVDYDFAAANYKLEIDVNAYAIQDDGFATVYDAWLAYNK